MIQLPNDAKAKGYKKTAPFSFEQVFESKSANFTGTEEEFLKAGFAHEYKQIDKFTRRTVS